MEWHVFVVFFTILWCSVLHPRSSTQHAAKRSLEAPVNLRQGAKEVEAESDNDEVIQSKLKVLLVGNQGNQHFPLMGYGGIEAHVEATAEGLYRNGVDFEVIVPAVTNRTNQSYPFPVHYTAFKPKSDRCKPRCTLFIDEVRSYIEAKSNESKPDVIWSQSDWSAHGLHDLGIPLIVSHGDSGPHKDLPSFPNVLHRFVSKNQRSRWVAANNRFKRKPSPLLNESFALWEGFPEDEFSLQVDKDPCTVLFVGRVIAEKGLNEFKQLAEWNPDCRFVVYGKERFTSPLKNIEFRGELKRGPDHKRAFQQATKFFMFVKWEEAFGRVVVEALSKGTPVLASTMGSLPELVSPEAGVVARDVKALNASLRQKLDPRVVFDYARNHFRAEDEVKMLLNVSRAMLKFPTNKEEMLKNIDPSLLVQDTRTRIA